MPKLLKRGRRRRLCECGCGDYIESHRSTSWCRYRRECARKISTIRKGRVNGTRPLLWTVKEVHILKSFFPICCIADMVQLLEGRSKRAIRQKAFKMGFKRKVTRCGKINFKLVQKR